MPFTVLRMSISYIMLCLKSLRGIILLVLFEIVQGGYLSDRRQTVTHLMLFYDLSSNFFAKDNLFLSQVGAIILYTYVFQMLAPPPGGYDGEEGNMPLKNSMRNSPSALASDASPERLPLLAEATPVYSNSTNKDKVRTLTNSSSAYNLWLVISFC